MSTTTTTMTETPHEKLLKRGARSLTNIELLQIITGEPKKTAKILDNRLIIASGESVGEITPEYVKTTNGIGKTKAEGIATVLAAVMEYGRRKYTKQTEPLIDSPESAAKQLDFIRGKKQEHFVLMTLDGARRLINTRVVTIGTLMSSLVHPREVFAPAIEDRAASIIIAHNHPSGLLDISAQDQEVSQRIKEAGVLLGIRLDDHIVVAGDDGEFASAM